MINSRSSRTIAAEATFDGHPDRIADGIVDAIHDEAIRLAHDVGGFPRVAVKCAVKRDVFLFGEITLPRGAKPLDFKKIAQKKIAQIGYTDASIGFSDRARVILNITKQSADIDQGVSRKRIGAGDQGHMYGGAVDEGADFMPKPISLAHQLARRIVFLRTSRKLPWLHPDGKCQVVVSYRGEKPVGVAHITIAASHDPKISEEDIRSKLYKLAVLPVLEKNKYRIDPKTQFVVNGTGKFVIYGPPGDGGVDCRKIIDDTYGGYFSHGGGGFHGKDATKVDVTGLVGARFVAKALVANGLAHKVQVHVAYVIGYPDPIAFDIETFGTAKYPQKELYRFAKKILDLSVGGIIDTLRLRNPIYEECAWGGLFGRPPNSQSFPWEKVPSL